MEETYLKVGNYRPESNGQEAFIEREYFRQGYIFKDEEAFCQHPDQVCYVPELSDGAYTRNDFLALCNGQEDFATECFDAVEWQHPETWVDEQYANQEWEYCPQCKRIYAMDGEVCACPACGWNPEEIGGGYEDRKDSCRPAEPGGV